MTGARPRRVHPGRRAGLLLALLFGLLLAATPASAQEPWVYEGGEPGRVSVTLGGIDIGGAKETGSAVRVDPSESVDLSISISSPADTTWEIRTVTVGLLVSGPGSTPPEALMRENAADVSLPPGFTVVLNRTVELGALQRAGAGTFLMQAQVIDAQGARLFTEEFYIQVPASVGALLTVQGAAITAVSLATGYGLWQVVKDAKEFRDAWDRHRKKIERAKLDVIGAAEHVAEEAVARVGHGLEKAVAFHRDVQDGEKQLGPLRWSATGLGLGGVAVAWLQFLGYLAFDGTRFVVFAVEGAAIFLTLALVANALLRRFGRRAQTAQKRRTLIPSESAPTQDAAVHPADKRG